MQQRLVITGVALALAACTSRPVVASSPSATASTRPSPSSALTGSPSPSLPPAQTVFAVIGDWGAGTTAQREIAERVCVERRARGFTTVLTTGDNFYPSGVATDSNYRGPSRCLIEAGIRWRATWGNHDIRGGMSTGRVLGAARYYAWSEAGADFIALDANRPGDSTQLQWLEGQLEASTARVKIVYFHQPPFSAGIHPDDEGVKRYWVPLFERHAVTLVLSGHNHDYERFRLRGVDYVTTGGGGAHLYSCRRRPAGLVRCVSEHNFLLLTVAPESVRVEVVTRSGARLDDFSIRAAAPASP